MKLKPKTLNTNVGSKKPISPKGADGDVEKLKQLRSSLYEERKNVDEKIKDVNRQILDVQLAPFKVGDKVVYDKEGDTICGILEYSDTADFPTIRPYKKNGKLSRRIFYVYPPRGKSYPDVLTITKVGD